MVIAVWRESVLVSEASSLDQASDGKANDEGADGVKERGDFCQQFSPIPAMHEDLEDIAECLRGHEHVEAAWLFGSLAQDRERPSSDLDVAVLGDRPLPSAEKEQLIERLARTSGRPIDLIDLQATRGPVVGRVLQNGIRLFCDDTALYAELIKRWWFDQADWLPYRRRILKDRRERWMRS